ncbi:MAG: type VI secretion protein IcmF/TssM N-terminal domain-containing protein [Planctomycetota bacterium]
MLSRLSAFVHLPMPLKIGILAITGGGIMTGMWYLLASLPRWISIIVIIGIAVVGLLVAIYARFLKHLRKRKAAPMEQGIMENVSAAPQGVSEPAKMARLDDLRKQFENGIEKYRSAGKSLYDFPWYLVVGEPGSGKTEAIRHCNVGFPSGLQDQFQGAGGTVNMNWWFTDYAVILDTAGRLMFEEVEAGGSGEWKEFLSLLKKSRPNCPINGVFLVIPSDSLIKDTADEIEAKASKIAQQFDVVQRTLDVRFPVFVIISKSDLIHGFRDFFENIEDPQLQHQIMGWSNPASLDEPYSPDFIDRQLKAINSRLFRRRLALMQQIRGGDGMGQHLSEVDTLYAYPQSLKKMAPRMARYLELIFSVGSQWSCKPLFFRGIYFTSSMQEGSALDTELAESLGVPVDSLPDGRVWTRDRAYFLRDLFMKKVFREKGLVTRATNAKKMYTRRKAAVLISAILSVTVLLFFTVYAAIRWNRSIGGLKEYMTYASQKMPHLTELKVIRTEEDDNKYNYIGNAEVKLDSGKKVRKSDFYAQLAGMVDRWRKDGVPWVFAPAAKFATSIKPRRLNEAQAVIYEKGVIQPFLEVASARLSQEQNGQWKLNRADLDDEVTLKVLHELLCVRAGIPLNTPALEENEARDVAYTAGIFLDPLFRYSFRAEENFEQRWKNYEEQHKEKLHKPMSMIYGDSNNDDFRVTWPPATILKTSQGTVNTVYNSTIAHGVELFNNYWGSQGMIDTERKDMSDIDEVRKIAAALDDFEAVEKDILKIYDSKSKRPFDKLQQSDFVVKWIENFEKLRGIQQILVGSTLKTAPSLQGRWDETTSKAFVEIDNNYNFLLKELDNIKEDDEFLHGIRVSLRTTHDELVKLRTTHDELVKRLADEKFKARLRELDEKFYATVQEDAKRRRLYEIRYEMYRSPYEHFVASRGPLEVDMIARLIERVKKDIEQARRQNEQLQGLRLSDEDLQHTAQDSLFALDVAEKNYLANIAKACLDEVMTKYSTKFPLKKNAVKHLTQKELEEVQKLLPAIQPEMLPVLPEDEKLRFDKVIQVLRSLPTGDSPYYCKISLLNPSEQDDSINYLRVVRIMQGSETGDRLRTSSGDVLHVAEYPGEPIKVEFYRYLDDTSPTATREFIGPWACLSMMHEDPDPEQKKFIAVKLKAEYEGSDLVLKEQELLLRLKLEFYADPGCTEEKKIVVPMAKDWP